MQPPPEASALRAEIVRVGQMMHARELVDGFSGNISARLGPGHILATPSGLAKGMLSPDQLLIVDLDGHLVEAAPGLRPTSELLMHLEAYRQRPDVKSVVHCHPPHATAFAVAREPIPQCVLPEVEVFLGDVPITRYETPGGQAFADTVLPFVSKTNVIILANHGTVSYGVDVEQAYWWTEILDAYCRMLMLARDLGKVNYFTEGKERELLDLKQKWGWSDPRNTPEYKDCDICANDIFRESWAGAGVERRAFDAPPAMGPGAKAAAPANDTEALVQLITTRVMEELAKAK